MVVLNDFLPICISSLKLHLSNKIREVLDERLDYFIESSTVIKKTKKKNIFDNIINDIKTTISSDHFLYLVMHDNYCVYKYKKGKKEGQYCAKKIRSNNPKKVYLCCQHDKEHIPKKKKTNKNINIETKNTYNKNDHNIDISDSKKNNKSEIIEKLIIQNKQIKDIKYMDHGYDDNRLNYIDIKIKEKDTNININTLFDDCKKNICMKKKDKIVNFNESNKKYIKKSKWKKLDISKDTGFTFS